MNRSKMPIAVITLSEKGRIVARKLSGKMSNCRLYVHQDVKDIQKEETAFPRTTELVQTLFDTGTAIVFVLPVGVATRAIAPHVRHKKTDPAVVVVDVGGRWAISLLSGHEGGANDLALQISNAIGAEPIVTTTTEAEKFLIVGVGCRRGTSVEDIQTAITRTLLNNGLSTKNVRMMASADIKADEVGLIEAAQNMEIPLRFISATEIEACAKTIVDSPFVQKKVNLPGVAEPAALLAGRKTTLIVPKQKFARVTVAIAMENCF